MSRDLPSVHAVEKDLQDLLPTASIPYAEYQVSQGYQKKKGRFPAPADDNC